MHRTRRRSAVDSVSLPRARGDAPERRKSPSRHGGTARARRNKQYAGRARSSPSDVRPPAHRHNHHTLSTQFSDRTPHRQPSHTVDVSHLLVRRQPSTTRQPARPDIRTQIIRNLLPHQGGPVMVNAISPISQHTTEGSPLQPAPPGYIRLQPAIPCYVQPAETGDHPCIYLTHTPASRESTSKAS